MARPKKIKSPMKLWEYFEKYRDEIRENPILIVEQKKGSTSIKVTAKDGEVNFVAPDNLVRLPKARPLTLEGFENWCEDNNIINDLGDYFSNKGNRYGAFAAICLRIKRVIRQDQIEGGMAGIYNASITQRLNNLVERTDHTSEGKEIIPITGMRIVNGEDRNARLEYLRQKLRNIDAEEESRNKNSDV